MVQRWREWWGDDDTNGMQMLCGWHGDGILIPYEWNVDAVWVAWGWHPHTLGSIRERQQRPAALGDHAQVRVRGTSTHATMLAVGRPGYRALWRLFSLNTLARCSPLDAPLGAGGVDPGSEWAHLGWGQRRALHTILDGVRGMPCIKSDACPVSSQRHALYQVRGMPCIKPTYCAPRHVAMRVHYTFSPRVAPAPLEGVILEGVILVPVPVPRLSQCAHSRHS